MIDLTTVIINQALKNEENLEVAFETWKAFSSRQIYERIRTEFIKVLITNINSTIKTKCALDISEVCWTDESTGNFINIHTILHGKNWINKFKLGMKDHDKDRLYFSIALISDNEDKRKKAHARIKQVLNEGNDFPNHWWSRVKNPYNNWESNYEGFKQFAFCDKVALEYFLGRFSTFIDIISNEMKDFC
ncbi:MAG: hypothetical protein WCO56_25320 [Verrucomicrobiota bacterium]